MDVFCLQTHMSTKTNFVLCVFLIFPAPFAAAQEFSLGVNAGAGVSVYRGVGTEYIAFPLINYDNNVIYIDGTEAGYYLFKTPHQEFTVNLNYIDTSLDPGDSSDRRIKRLDRRRSTVMAGVTYTFRSDWGEIQAQILGDTLSRNKGFSADLRYTAQFQTGPLTYVPSIGATWYNSDYNNYYYGVSGNESRRSGLRHYDSGSGVNPYVELLVNYAATKNWNVFVSGRYEHLNSTIKDSPIVNKSGEASFHTGISYKFK